MSKKHKKQLKKLLEISDILDHKVAKLDSHLQDAQIAIEGLLHKVGLHGNDIHYLKNPPRPGLDIKVLAKKILCFEHSLNQHGVKIVAEPPTPDSSPGTEWDFVNENQ